MSVLQKQLLDVRLLGLEGFVLVADRLDDGRGEIPLLQHAGAHVCLVETEQGKLRSAVIEREAPFDEPFDGAVRRDEVMIDRQPAVVVIDPSRLGGRKATRRAVEQTHFQPLLQPTHGIADRGFGHAKLLAEERGRVELGLGPDEPVPSAVAARHEQTLEVQQEARRRAGAEREAAEQALAELVGAGA